MLRRYQHILKNTVPLVKAFLTTLKTKGLKVATIKSLNFISGRMDIFADKHAVCPIFLGFSEASIAGLRKEQADVGFIQFLKRRTLLGDVLADRRYVIFLENEDHLKDAIAVRSLSHLNRLIVTPKVLNVMSHLEKALYCDYIVGETVRKGNLQVNGVNIDLRENFFPFVFFMYQLIHSHENRLVHPDFPVSKVIETGAPPRKSPKQYAMEIVRDSNPKNLVGDTFREALNQSEGIFHISTVSEAVFWWFNDHDPHGFMIASSNADVLIAMLQKGIFVIESGGQ